MNDYLAVFEKFKDVKDILDYIDEVKSLRYYFNTRQYQKMREHIDSLTKKYILETIAWNLSNRVAPITDKQAYINAENFMCLQGAKLVVEKVNDFKNRLSKEEIAYIETLLQSEK